jgi:hypothetical protein
MKSCIGAATLMLLATAGSMGTVDVALAAKVITVPRAVPIQARQQRVFADRRVYAEPYYGGWGYYYGRPLHYIPAPFPLGFDFGFGW